MEQEHQQESQEVGKESISRERTTLTTSSDIPNIDNSQERHDVEQLIMAINASPKVQQLKEWINQVDRNVVKEFILGIEGGNNSNPEQEDPTKYEEKVDFSQLQEGIDYVYLTTGSTLSSIAATKGIDVDLIRQLNPNASANSRDLPVGMRVLIRANPENIGAIIDKVGFVKGAGGEDAYLYSKASVSTAIATVRYGTKVHIEKTDVSGTWYYVNFGGVRGWIQAFYVTTNIPMQDPQAKLTYVNQMEMLENILGTEYSPNKETSYWHYAMGAYLLNPTSFVYNQGKAQEFWATQNSTYRGQSKILMDSEMQIQLLYNSLELKANHHIWLPSVEYVERAKASGLIPSRGEMEQGVINIAEGIESFTSQAWSSFNGRIEEEISGLIESLKGLPALVKEILSNLHTIISDIWDYIKSFSVEQFLTMLLDAIIDPVLRMAIQDAFNNINNTNIEVKYGSFGVVAGLAIALGAISFIGQKADALLDVLKKLSPSLGNLLNPKRQGVLTMPNGQKIRVGIDDNDPLMRMEGKDGNNSDNKPKREDNTRKERQNILDDEIDEHDLGAMEDREREALFKRDAERGIYRGKMLRNQDGSRPLELDRVDIKNKVIIEDKLAEGFERNPRGLDVAIDNWTKKNVYNNAKKKIDYLTHRADHIYDNVEDKTSSPYSPNLSEIKEIKHIKYKLKASENAYEGKLKEKVEEAIEQLKTDYPDWKINVEYK